MLLIRFIEFYVDGFCYQCEGKSHLKKYAAETANLKIIDKSKQTKEQPNKPTKNRTTDMFWYPKL